MSTRHRRDFLKLLAAATPGLALASRLDASQLGSRSKSAEPRKTTLDRYIDPLPIPSRLLPYEKRRNQLRFRVRIVEFEKRLHSQLPPTRLWGYEGQYPGPTFEAFQDQSIEVRWENRLPTQHLFPIDSHIHGAMPPSSAVRTVPHLHGSRSPSSSDGLPERWFTPGSSAHYSYPNSQPAATLWYHDHAVGITRLNVYAGLSGFFLLRDNEELGMGLPSGDYEIPLLLQDRTLDGTGQLVYSPTFEDGSEPPDGGWAPEFFGQLPVVNGAIYPFLEVEPRPYRLRLLNGANSRFFDLYLNLAKRPEDIPSLVSFHQIGSDGGLLPKPAPLTTLLLGPAERADVIVDFSGLEGKTVTLSNKAAVPYPGWNVLATVHERLAELMQFRVTRSLTGTKKNFDLALSRPFKNLDEAASVATRDFVLSEKMDSNGHSLGVRINDKGYDEPVTEIVKLGTTEKWRFINNTDDSHPMHLHLVQFQILQRQGFDPFAFQRGKLVLAGTPRKPAANEMGWKDTAVVSPSEILTILVRFEGFTGRYVFHCHMLEHEDNDMMRPYEVVSS
jgi:spore coat protein A